MNDRLFSRRANQCTSPMIRRILKVAEQPEIISFAAGLPSPATFPVERIREATRRVLSDAPQAALQYSATEGYLPLREFLARRHATPQHPIGPENVLITTGSQQALDLLGKIFIDEGSRVLIEAPSYLGALQSFSQYAPQYVPVPTDDDGLIPEALTVEMTDGARFLYAMPNFQNPTGRRLPLARRRTLADIARQRNMLIVEDDPYGALDYEGMPLPTLLSLAPDQVIHLGTFSKILAPGLRLGYVIAPAEICTMLAQAKQAADLHTPSLLQRVAHETIKDGFLDTHIPAIRTLYASQCQCMLDALARHMPSQARWNRPAGGMFIWMTLPETIDTMALLEQAVAHRVIFVPGASFFVDTPQKHTLRLSFVTVPAERIEQGVAILARLIADALKTCTA